MNILGLKVECGLHDFKVDLLSWQEYINTNTHQARSGLKPELLDCPQLLSTIRGKPIERGHIYQY